MRGPLVEFISKMTLPGCRRVETATQQVDPDRFCRGRLFRGFDMHMSQAAFALELAQVVNGVFLVRSQHRRTVRASRVCGKAERSHLCNAYGYLRKYSQAEKTF